MTELYFTKPDSWSNGYFELHIQLGERSEMRLLNAVNAVLDSPAIDGYYLKRNIEPNFQNKIQVKPEHLVSEDDSGGVWPFHAVATMPNSIQIACLVTAFHFVDGQDGLAIKLSIRDLGYAYNVRGFPFNPSGSDEEWLVPVENWLAEIGQYVYKKVPFHLGVMGDEYSDTLQDYQHFVEHGFPEERYLGILYAENGELKYYPRTRVW